MEKVIHKYNLYDPQQYEDEKAYWKSKSPAERLQAAELLRKQYCKLKGYGSEPRLQRVYRITKRA